MHHPIKRIPCIVCSVAVLVLAGCGKSQAEKAATENERQRLELEKQAALEQQQGNKAIADIEKKIGRKPKPLDLNLPPEKKTDAAQTAPPKQ